MSWIPGWDTIAGTSWWGGFFFWMSIGSLIGLGAFEVASHRYGDRHDELVEQQRAAEKRQHDDEIARLHLETAKANEKTEELRRQNLALEEAASPRILEINAPASELKQYAGSEVAVSTIPEYEARRLAESLVAVFEKAEWKKPIPTGIDDSFDGVTVMYVKQRPPTLTPSNPAEPTVEESMQQVRNSMAAQQKTGPRRLRAEAIALQLEKAKIAVQVLFVPSTRLAELKWPQGFSEDGIVVRVGFKPTTYFLEQKYPELKQFRESHEQVRRELQEYHERMQELARKARQPPDTDKK